MNPGRPTFSLCMIVRNEAANLPHSLGPIAGGFDEVVVVDTGSTDGTQELARSYGARVIEITWPDDFAAARNVSIEAARGDWILWLDADNALGAASVDVLRNHLDQQRESILWCTEIVVPDGERLLQKRVFPRRPEVFFSGRVHEQLTHPPFYPLIVTNVEIQHWGYSDRTQAAEKGRRNLRLLLAMAEDSPHDLYLCYQLGKTLLNLRRFDQAVFWLNQAVTANGGFKLNPGIFRHAHLLLAQVQDRLGQSKEAEKTLTDLIQAFPAYGPGLFHLGRLAYTKGNLAQAAAHLEKSLQLGLDEPWVGLSPTQMSFTAASILGRIMTMLGDNQKAEQAFHLAVQARPDHPEPYLSLAELAMNRGRTPEAQAYLATCLEKNPRHRKAAVLASRVAADG